MTADRTADLLAQLLAGACDDERVRLPPRATHRLAQRMAELAEVSGYRLVPQAPATGPTGEWIRVERDTDGG